MFIDPRAVFFLIVLVGVTGFVARGLLVTWFKLSRGDSRSSDSLRDMEERLRKVEAATSSLLVDVSGMREKERFMARLQAGAVTTPKPDSRSEDTLSPLVTQNIPIVRAGRARP